jgi:hypothetical protein
LAIIFDRSTPRKRTGRIALFRNSERWREVSPPLSFNQVGLFTLKMSK